MPKKAHKAMLLGIGLDSDGHRRLTAGPNFLLAGGSAETHEAMTEKVVKIMEKLAAKGKTLESVSRQELFGWLCSPGAALFCLRDFGWVSGVVEWRRGHPGAKGRGAFDAGSRGGGPPSKESQVREGGAWFCG